MRSCGPEGRASGIGARPARVTSRAFWLAGKWNAKRRTKDAVRTLETWCDGGKFDACRTLAKAFKDGEPYNDPTELKPDAKKFEAFQKKACATNDPRRLEESSIIRCGA